ncbi:MAG: acetolactate synthase small subunit [Deltaproteobacteria bacterium]|jgi:acetolactate synthase-1/3 small subunit|nr:acetolactate synthase small subunit [Deltaproteobacteria bacterium]
MERSENAQRHTLAILVDNSPGVLARVTALISGRGFNIDSLSVAETNEPEVSLITLITVGTPRIISQVIKQLRKLINVIKVTDLAEVDYVERQLVMIRVKAVDNQRAEITRLADIFRAKIIDVCPKTYTLEITGGQEKIRAALALLSEFGVEEQVSTGLTAISRSPILGKKTKKAEA